jgi:hypothetical protein
VARHVQREAAVRVARGVLDPDGGAVQLGERLAAVEEPGRVGRGQLDAGGRDLERVGLRRAARDELADRRLAEQQRDEEAVSAR